MNPSSQPLISVVIPVYNRAALIAATLNSVQQQTHTTWEAIVVDDASKDDTPQVVTALALSDPRIRFIRQDKNRGAQAARNVGIRAARGRWISFLDSDDHYLPNSLELRMETLLSKNVRVVHSECNWVGKDGIVKPYGIPHLSGWVYEQVLAEPAPLFQTLLVAKDALEKIGYLDEKIVSFQEWDTFIRLAKRYPFGFVATPTFLYDARQPDSMSRNDLLGARGYTQVFRKHFLANLAAIGPSGLAQHYKVAASWYEKGGDHVAAKRCQSIARLWSWLDPKFALRKFGRALNFTRS